MKRILAIWLAAALFAAQPCYAVVMVGFGQSAAPAGYSDSFTGADDTLLSAHDANWVSLSAGRPVGNFKLSSNRCIATAWTSAGALYSASTSDTSRITVVGNANPIFRDVHVRATSNSTTGYSCTLRGISEGNWTELRILKNGDYLGTGTISQALNSTYEMKIVASGSSTTTVTCYINGVASSTATDSSSPILSGNPGFSVDSGSYNAGSDFDNWSDN